MAAPDTVYQFVERFHDNREGLKRSAYGETEVRVQFIDPLFEALGWDVRNTGGRALGDMEVVHEDEVKVGMAHKAPDYGFYAGRERKFFVEAKKPSVNLKQDPEPAFQLRRYAWSAKLPVSVLTDFEEFAIYDSRVQPGKNDSAAVARLQHITYDTFVERWDEIANLFSRDAVYEGSIDRWVDKQASPRGKESVDRAFLSEIERWRELLARSIARNNPELTQRELNFAVQMTVDRILFLRMAEDRQIEQYGRLLALTNGGDIYARFQGLFREADERYNSGLFHFNPERGRPEQPDNLTPRLTIDDRTLRGIFTNLYYPNSPYEFSVLPVDVLGQVYEQFLGKVITLTSHGSVEIEEKPEVRKAGGVYYTPTYIVDYIVEHTVGKLLEGKSPRQAEKLKIVDPACGSGSFLIGAYQYLLTWHRDRYLAEGPAKHAKKLYQAVGGEWRLTTDERKRILRNNIYGVDIDPQAVEVTKLSLMLKLLEGETSQTLNRQLSFLRERVLPDMGANIKCGNSLIGPDFCDNQQMTLLPTEDQYRINVFDWQAEFPEIMKQGGFDAVIGNPPYLSYSGRQAVELIPAEREYLFDRYDASSWPTSHSFFIERSIRLLSRRFVSFIVPDQVAHLAGYRSVRQVVNDASKLVEVRYWGEQVFANVTTPVLTFVCDRQFTEQTLIIELDGTESTQDIQPGDEWTSSATNAILDRIRGTGMTLGTLVADPGVHTGNVSKAIILKSADATSDAVPVLEGKQISRYQCDPPNKTVRLGYRAKEGEYYSIRPEERYARSEFVIRQTASFPIVGPRKHAVYFRNSLLALYAPPPPLSVSYLVGLLNSRLIRYAYQHSVKESRQKAFPQVKVRALRELPIRTIDFANPTDVALHDQVVSLVERMLALNEQAQAARTSHDKTILQRQIESTDGQIDRLVYQLYELTDDEIAIVEAETAVKAPRG